MHHAVYVDAYTRECTGMYVFAVTHARKHKYMSPCMCLLCMHYRGILYHRNTIIHFHAKSKNQFK